MSFPPVVSRYLQALDKTTRRSVCFRVNAQNQLQEWWGDVSTVTDAHPVVGQNACDLLPFLYGMDIRTENFIEFANLDAGVFHIHVFQENVHSYLLLIPADEEHARRMELQQIANEVRLLNARQEHLLEELEQARAELEIKRAEAQHASMVKSRFIASMSHEFRTPLASVIGYTELLSGEIGKDSEALAHARAIGRSARHLLSMVDNILDQSRLEEGNIAIRIAPHNVRQVIDDITAMMAPLAAEKFLAFAAYVDESVPRAVKTDEVRLRQILINLLGNAIKFTDAGEVRIEASWAEEQLSIVISDTGPGIPLHHQKRIFNAFHRVDERDGKRGTGLGLNITARIVELLGGTVEIFSDPGQGSRFCVTIAAPRTEEFVAADQLYGTGSGERPAPSQTRRILVAEDDLDLIDLFSLFLERGGYQVILANNGQQAIELALAEQPDLVLMDVNMPSMDGLSATRTLRSKGFNRPILALTASLSVDDRDQAFAWGCDGYLVKPISMPELLSAIDRYLNDQRNVDNEVQRGRSAEDSITDQRIER